MEECVMRDLYSILKKLNIFFEEVSHPPAFTVLDIQKLDLKIEGTGCKNLFLTDHKKFYLYILEESKKADLKKLAKILSVSRLSFASVEDLKTILKLEQGSVTPFGIINDLENQVLLILDQSLKQKKLLFHPLVNTKTISIEFDDLIRFIEFEKHDYILL